MTTERNVMDGVPLPPAPEELPPSEDTNVVTLSSGQKKPSKAEMKRVQMYQERLRRHMNRGLTEDQALAAIQKEDYDRMPTEEKVRRLQASVAQMTRGFVGDFQAIRQNQDVLAEALDVNFRAFAKMLVKLGLSLEDQKKIVDETVAELDAARKAAQEKAVDAAEKTTAEKALAEADKGQDEAPAEPAPIPDGATVFGG